MIDMVVRRLRQESDDRGFTLIEIVVAIIIFSILAAIAIPVYLNQQKTAIEQQLKITLTNASIILKQERAGANGRYPTLLPADVVIPEDVSLTYTNSKNREAYCLEATHAGDPENKMFLNGDDKGDSTISEHDCTYDASGPASTILSGDVNTDNQPLLSWTPVEGTTSYSVENLTTGDSFTVSGSTSWTGEPMDTPQSFRVIVNAGGTTSDPSNTVRLTPPDIRPTVTPVLTINNVSGSASQRTGTLQWQPVKWADEYIIVNADTNDEMWRGSAYNLDISASVGKVTRVYLIASNSAGQSPHSNVVELIGPLPTSPVLNITTETDVNGTKATLTWNEVPGATTYRLYKNGTVISNDASSGFSDTTGWNNGIINYYVLPLTEAESPGDRSNDVSYDSTMPLPSIPALKSANLEPHPLGPSWGWVYKVSWHPSDFAQKYTSRHRINGGNWITPNMPEGQVSYGIAPIIEPGDKIDIQWRAENYAGASPWSPVISYTYEIDTPTVSRTQITGGNHVQITASCPTPGTDIRARYRHDASGSMGNWVTTNSTQATIDTLLYGHSTRVEWEIWCHVSTDISKKSDTITRVVSLPTKSVPAPNATVSNYPSFQQEMNYDVDKRRWIVDISLSNIAYGRVDVCPPGTYISKRIRWVNVPRGGGHSPTPGTWTTWSGPNPPGAYTSKLQLEAKSNFSSITTNVQVRCVANNNTSMVGPLIDIKNFTPDIQTPPSPIWGQ